MAKQTSVNTQPATGTVAMFTWRTTMLAAGWVDVEGSDGVSAYVPGTDTITGSGSGAGGLGNAGAWFRLRDKDGRREYAVQRGTHTTWRIKYSALARFTGGSPGTTRTPAATDEQYLCGGGSDASPSYTAFLPTDNTYRLHVCCQDAPIGNVYAWSIFTTTVGTGVAASFAFHDAYNPSFVQAANTDRIIWAFYVGTAMTVNNLNSSGTKGGWWKFGLADAAWMTGQYFFAWVAGNGDAIYPGGAGANPYTQNHEGMGMLVGRYGGLAGQVGVQGVTATILFKGAGLSYPDTINKALGCYVYFGDFLVPYADGVTPLV